MLESEVEEFLVNLDLLERYIKSNLLKIVEVLSDMDNISSEGTNLDKFISNYHRMRGFRKRFDYCGVTILLYGYLERFLEGVVLAYLRDLTSLIEEFDDLPKNIQENHFSKSIELSKKLKLGKYKNLTTQEEIVKNLFECQNRNGLKYNLNIHAYTIHEANFRDQVIQGVFSSVGIHDVHKKVAFERDFMNFLRGWSSDLQNFTVERLSQEKTGYLKSARREIASVFNELARMRNEISHGAEFELVSLSTICSVHISFLRQYSISLKNILTNSLLPYQINRYGYFLGYPVKTWRKGYVAGFRIQNIDRIISVKVGDTIILKTKKGDFSSLKVEEIRSNLVSKESLAISEECQEFTLRFNSHVKENQQFFLLTKENLSRQ